MTTAELTWTERFRVRSDEMDLHGRAAITAVCNWLQEVAGNHARSLGWGIEQLAAEQLTWVLARLHLRLDRLPAWRDEVTVTTWPAGVDRLYAVREFRLEDGRGLVGVATTGWVLVHLGRRRPVRPPVALAALGRDGPGRTLADRFEPLDPAVTAAHEEEFTVRFGDVDRNRHANNVRLIGWALETLPLEVLERPLAELEVDFRSEAQLGATVRAIAERAAGDAAVFRHRLEGSDGREIVRARSRFDDGQG
jgi:acyl-ACP thioesterase